MKKIVSLLALAAIVVTGFAFAEKSDTDLKVGDKAPLTSAKLIDINNKETSLENLKKEGGLLVIFSCNTCPFVVAWEDRYNGLNDLATNNNIGMVLINSNEAKRAGDDSLEKMKAHASKLGYTAPYVIDADHKIADAFGAASTPHVYLFDKDMKLVYVGAIDDNYKDASQVKETYVANAIKNLATNKPISPNQTKAIGCSIKRVKK